MSIASYIDLEKLILRFPRASLRGTIKSQLQISGLQPAILPGCSGFDFLVSLERTWIQRGQQLRLELVISVDGKPAEPRNLEGLEDALLCAKMWRQLGLRAVPHMGDSTIVRRNSSGCVMIGLQYRERNDEKRLPSIYDMCYQIPALDVMPPSGVKTVNLDALRFDLTVIRQEIKACPRKRKKTDLDMLEDSGSEQELLLTSPNSLSTDTEAIVAMVDAGLRLHISGESGPGSRRRALIDGLTAKFLAASSPLAMIVPTVFDSGYLGAVSTRAALLPTVAHALSQSLYTHTKSQSLKSKLQRLFQDGLDDDDGQAIFDSRAQEELLKPRKRMDIVSSCLWQVLQRQLLRGRSTPKLDSMTSRAAVPKYEEEEDLFTTSQGSEWNTRFDQDEMQEYAWMDEDSELLFDEYSSKYGIDDENLFDLDDDVERGTPPPSLYSDAAMLNEDDDGDLLLDLFLDEGCSDE